MSALVQLLWGDSSASIQCHLDRTMETMETYKVPLEDDTAEMRDFIQTFNVSDKTDDILHTLQETPSVKAMFEALVPVQVSYEQFWMRFFYRCDMQRIERRLCDEVQANKWSLPNPLNAVPNPLSVILGTFDGEKEIAFRRNLEDVYTTPLLCDLSANDAASSWETMYELEETRQFLSVFRVEEKTDEIATILKEHKDTVFVYFEALVPVDVTYADFWARYFFRCDEERVTRAWHAYQNHLQKERKQTIDTVKTMVVNKSKNVIVTPIKSAMKTSLYVGNALVSTALVPVGVIANAASTVVLPSNRSIKETTATQTKHRVKLLQKKLVETKRKLRESKADASRLRNELMKAHDALNVRQEPKPAAITFAKRKATTSLIEDNTLSSSMTEDSILCEQWAADDEKDSSETSITVDEDGLSTATPRVPSSTIFQALRSSALPVHN